MERWAAPGGGILSLDLGDLTQARVDAIVNAANTSLLGGGGVDGAIHRAAGPALLDACRDLPAVGGVRCPTGEARLTSGFRLPARFIIHTVGPIFSRSADAPALLAAAHRSSLELARTYDAPRVAFPAISCGVYGYPPEDAAPVAVAAALQHGRDLEEVRFVLFSDRLLQIWRQAVVAALGDPLSPEGQEERRG